LLLAAQHTRYSIVGISALPESKKCQQLIQRQTRIHRRPITPKHKQRNISRPGIRLTLRQPIPNAHYLGVLALNTHVPGATDDVASALAAALPVTARRRPAVGTEKVNDLALEPVALRPRLSTQRRPTRQSHAASFMAPG
jgi:hypothetical protein